MNVIRRLTSHRAEAWLERTIRTAEFKVPYEQLQSQYVDKKG